MTIGSPEPGNPSPKDLHSIRIIRALRRARRLQRCTNLCKRTGRMQPHLSDKKREFNATHPLPGSNSSNKAGFLTQANTNTQIASLILMKAEQILCPPTAHPPHKPCSRVSTKAVHNSVDVVLVRPYRPDLACVTHYCSIHGRIELTIFVD